MATDIGSAHPNALDILLGSSDLWRAKGRMEFYWFFSAVFPVSFSIVGKGWLGIRFSVLPHSFLMGVG